MYLQLFQVYIVTHKINRVNLKLSIFLKTIYIDFYVSNGYLCHSVGVFDVYPHICYSQIFSSIYVKRLCEYKMCGSNSQRDNNPTCKLMKQIQGLEMLYFSPDFLFPLVQETCSFLLECFDIILMYSSSLLTILF